MKKHIFHVTSTISTARLDKILVGLIPTISRSHIQKTIKDNNVKVNNIIISDLSYKIKENDIIEITLYEADNTMMQKNAIKLDIVFEDEDLIVINKPWGLTVHPGAGNHQDTLVNGLLSYTDELSDINGDNTRPGIVHRLDKDTSGLMIVAKNNKSHLSLAHQIEKRTFVRKYLALAWGVINPTSGIIENNIGRAKNSRQKMTVLKEGGKKAITEYCLKEIFQNGLMSLIECKLNTGRTHQIRVHLSHLGHSIVGDQIYGANNKKIKNASEFLKSHIKDLRRQGLHSYYIAFSHPTTNEIKEFKIELPSDIKELINVLKT